MSLVRPYYALERDSIDARVTTTVAPVVPGDSWEPLNGVVTDNHAAGSSLSTSGMLRIDDAAGGGVLVRVDLALQALFDASEIEVGLSINGADPTHVSAVVVPASTSSFEPVFFTERVTPAASEYVQVMVRCPDSETTGVIAQRGQMQGLRLGIQWSGGGGGGLVTPVLPGNAFSYIDADSAGLSGSASDPAAAWNSLPDAVAGGGPYHWSSVAPGAIDESTMSGGRRSVLLNGSDQYLSGNAAIAAAISGTNVPYTSYIHGQILTLVSNDTMFAFGNSGETSTFDFLRMRPSEVLRVQRTGVNADSDTGALTAVEFKIVCVHHGATRTVWLNGVKLLDGIAFSSAELTFNTLTIGAWINTGVSGPSHMTVRRAGIWNVALNDTQAQALPGVGT